jgi:hypothetical protein
MQINKKLITVKSIYLTAQAKLSGLDRIFGLYLLTTISAFSIQGEIQSRYPIIGQDDKMYKKKQVYVSCIVIKYAGILGIFSCVSFSFLGGGYMKTLSVYIASNGG